MTTAQIRAILEEAGMSEDSIAHSLRVRDACIADGLHTDFTDAAGLHDIREDCGVTAEWLEARGVRPEVIGIVRNLTRSPKHETYAQYIRRLLPGSRRIKVRDIEDNLTRGPIPGDLERRYRRALTMLDGR